MANRQPNSSQWLIGVDVGGTTVATLLTDAQLRPQQTLSIATDLSTPDATLDGIASAIQQTLDIAGITVKDLGAIGLGVPGAVDVEYGISRMAVNLHWYDYPVASQLHARFGVPAYLENDVRVATLGVHRFDNPDQKQNLVYVSVGTGVAAGVILDGKLFRGRQGLAGEIGHWIVDPAGPVCNCGARGCLETLISATAVVRMAREAVAAGNETQLSACRPLTARDVYESAAAGDQVAQSIVDYVGAELGRALRNVVLAYDSEAVVLGGGPTRAGAQFLHPIVAEWERQHTTSALARALLRPEMIRIADPERNMGAWGAVALAAGQMQGRGFVYSPKLRD